MWEPRKKTQKDISKYHNKEIKVRIFKQEDAVFEKNGRNE